MTLNYIQAPIFKMGYLIPRITGSDGRSLTAAGSNVTIWIFQTYFALEGRGRGVSW